MKDQKITRIQCVAEKSPNITTVAKLLAHAAAIYGRYSTYLAQSLPPRKRTVEVHHTIISHTPIGAVLVQQPDICCVFDQMGYEYLLRQLPQQWSSDTLFFYDPAQVSFDNALGKSSVKIQAHTALKKHPQLLAYWPIVVLGCVIRLMRLVSLESISQAIRSQIPESEVQCFLKALDIGSKLSKSVKC